MCLPWCAGLGPITRAAIVVTLPLKHPFVGALLHNCMQELIVDYSTHDNSRRLSHWPMLYDVSWAWAEIQARTEIH
jgi:hypothetical protein